MGSRCCSLFLLFAATAAAQCEWVDVGGGVSNPLFGTPGYNQAAVHALAVYDGGTGPELYAAGRFLQAGNVSASLVGRWDGTAWSNLAGFTASGSQNPPQTMAVHDEGAGPRLFLGSAGFWFPPTGIPSGHCVLRFDGTAFSTVGSGLSGFVVRDLESVDVGAGSDLWAAVATFANAPPSGVMRWDGAGWTPVGNLPDAREIAVFDAGAGPRVHAATDSGLFRWDGSTWLLEGAVANVEAATTYDDGAGPALYLAGDFSEAGGVPARGIVKWDGALWTALGTGLPRRAKTLAVHDDGNGPRLVVGGDFQRAGGAPARHVASWDGGTWRPLGAGVQSAELPTTTRVETLAVFQGALHVGGELYMSGSGPLRHVARWTGTPCSPTVQVIQDGHPVISPAISLVDAGLVPGRTYRNLLSVPGPMGGACPLPGSGPVLGLCFPDLALLWLQLAIGPGSPPLHFTATSPAVTFGPYVPIPTLVGNGVIIDVVCIDMTNGTLNAVSTVARVGLF